MNVIVKSGDVEKVPCWLFSMLRDASDNNGIVELSYNLDGSIVLVLDRLSYCYRLWGFLDDAKMSYQVSEVNPYRLVLHPVG